MTGPYEKYLPWLVLREIPFLGNTLYKKLIDRFHSPLSVLEASEPELASVSRISKRAITGIRNHRTYIEKAKRELDFIARQNLKVVVLTDGAYPDLLRQIQDPPPVLTYQGSIDNTAPCLSIVGSRNATSYGLSTSENLAGKLALKGFQIVSGLARGIDARAHQGALKAKGRTIAVLGSGLNKIYPKENTPLFHRICENGTVFSEFKVNADPLPAHFPIRNRVIAGLSCGAVVVEAARRSGSLITARLAGEYNREVFAVPGSIKSKKSEGTHALLKQGAKLVENEMDIIDELYHFVHASTGKNKDCPLQTENVPQNNNNEKNGCSVKKYLEPYPVHIDVLIQKSGLKSSQVISQLLDLELKGIAVRHQGNYYSISEDYH